MSNIRSAINAHLAAATAVTAIVNDRIYPVALPQDRPRPAITFSREKSGHDHNLKKASGTSLATIRVNSWGDKYKDAAALSEAVRVAMQGFSGTADGVKIDCMTLMDDYDEFVQPQDGSDKGIFAVVFEFHIRYQESIPTFS